MSEATRATEATTTSAPTRGWQRTAAGLLYVAALLGLIFNTWTLVIYVIGFTGGSEVTVGLSHSDDTDLGGQAFSAYLSEATFWSGDFTFWPQLWVAIARLLACLVWVTVAVCVLVFAYGAYHGEVFSRRLPTLLTVAAVAVGVGASLANWLTMWGVTTGVNDLQILHPSLRLGWNWTSDPTWTILAGLVLALLAVVFRSGLRLQRETEGLV